MENETLGGGMKPREWAILVVMAIILATVPVTAWWSVEAFKHCHEAEPWWYCLRLIVK